ncbi:MAG: hypothetical protein PWQ20_1093 [Thermotogaceae bacterium]|jgi:hypothetical protein|nr:hypothetical protein [Thermotogaceae bacterium]MDN5338023.1 hypothetical protein [Thermotogaceae bacterium]
MNVEKIKEKLLDRFYNEKYIDALKRYSYIFGKLRNLLKKNDHEGFINLLSEELNLRIEPQILKEVIADLKKYGTEKILNVLIKKNIDVTQVSTILFILYPKRFFPYSSKYLKEFDIKKKVNFSEFQFIIQKIINVCDFIENNLELYTLLNMDEVKLVFFEDVDYLVHKIKEFDFLKITPEGIKELREEITLLKEEEKKYLRGKLKGVNQYLLRVIFEKSYFEVVIDGNNIVHTSLRPSIKNIFHLFECIAKLKHLLFPFTIVFDKNIKYLIPKSELLFFKERFENNPNVIFHSPADELIYELHLARKALIISNDRFREYDIKSSAFLRYKEGRLTGN